jgi:hypothetical protein
MLSSSYKRAGREGRPQGSPAEAKRPRLADTACYIHCGVEVTELSTNKQHTLSAALTFLQTMTCAVSTALGGRAVTDSHKMSPQLQQ